MVKKILVVGGDKKVDWKDLFAGQKVYDEEIQIERAHWDEIVLVNYSDSGVVLTLLRPNQPSLHYTPDFILIRSAARGIYQQDYRNILYGFMYSRIPSINTFDSLYLCQEKPLIYSRLNQIMKNVGKDTFPLIPQTYYGNWQAMSFHCGVPLVVKLGTCHSGFGKMRILSDGDFEDFRSVAALQGSYITAEPFIEWDYDIRIQKIGHHYRAFRRTSTHWKGKSSNQQDEDIPVTDRYKKWVDLASEHFGMDVCAIDAVHSKSDDKEYILELNDSAIGFNLRHKDEDFVHLRDLVLAKMMQEFAPKEQKKEIEEVSVDNEGNHADCFDSLPVEEQLVRLKLKVQQLEQELQNKNAAVEPTKSGSKNFISSLFGAKN